MTVETREGWLDHLATIVFEAQDAWYNRTHPESAAEVREETGEEPTDRAVNRVFFMAFGDLLAAKGNDLTALEVHNRMADVAHNLK